MDNKKAIVFRYRFSKSEDKHIFEEFKGRLYGGTFIPDDRQYEKWYFHNSAEGEISHERIWYYLEEDSEEEINKLRKQALKRLYDSKRAYQNKLESTLVKVNKDVGYLRVLMSNLN